jgi:tight adherence protein C
MILVAFLGFLLVIAAVAFIVTAAAEPRARRTEHLGQIESYGYLGKSTGERRKLELRRSLDELAAVIGTKAAQRLRNLREDELQRRLLAAGFYGVGPRQFLGYRVLLTFALPILMGWLLVLLGSPIVVTIIFVALTAFCGWLVPSFVIGQRARTRLRKIDDTLPELIDLLVVTLEAGIAFTPALRLAAERLEGPLGDEVRLTIHEQSLGLSTMEAIESWQARCDTPAVRSFVRAMVQGERLGVSIGQILRNLAVEMRARRQAVLTERAQKAPIKILFPLVFLIFPAMFLVILGPVIYRLSRGLAH